MIKRHQLFRNETHNDIWGDCHRTAIACLLDLEPWHVPHFGQLAAITPGYNWESAVEAFLATRGYCSAKIAIDGEAPLSSVLDYMGTYNSSIYFLLGGRSPRGTNHTVVCLGGRLYHDPHPDGGFVVGPLSNGFYEIDFLMPISMRFAEAM